MPSYWTDKDERMYQEIKKSLIKSGRATEKAEEIAAKTVNKKRSKRKRKVKK